MNPRVLLLGLLLVLISSNRFNYGSSMIPHPDKVHKGGEDAYLATSNLLIVADGVGGWSEMGIDAGQFSKTLISNAQSAWSRNAEFYSTRPQQLMIDSLRSNNKQGSSTMTIVTMDRNGRVYSANIGDSGYKWLRRHPNGQFQILFQSPQQQHSFNFPYQLASPMSRQAKGDDPSSSQIQSHNPQHNDFFILGTDGLFDNIFMKEIIDIMNREGRYDRNGEMINKDHVARVLSQRAINYGKNKNYYSPFSEHAQKNGQSYQGGKLDDTTVIIAQVELSNHNLRGSQFGLSNSNVGRAAASFFDNLSGNNINQRLANNFARAFPSHKHLHH